MFYKVNADEVQAEDQGVQSPSPPVFVKVGAKEKEFRFCLPNKHIKTAPDLKRFQASEAYATLKVCAVNQLDISRLSWKFSYSICSGKYQEVDEHRTKPTHFAITMAE